MSNCDVCKKSYDLTDLELIDVNAALMIVACQDCIDNGSLLQWKQDLYDNITRRRNDEDG